MSNTWILKDADAFFLKHFGRRIAQQTRNGPTGVRDVRSDHPLRPRWRAAGGPGKVNDKHKPKTKKTFKHIIMGSQWLF